MKYFIKTFGCQQNIADSERIKNAYKKRGIKESKTYQKADYVIINTCMIRESAENRIYGLINNLTKQKILNSRLKIIVTGCLVGIAMKDKTGKFLKQLKNKLPTVDEFMPIEEVGFDTPPIRGSSDTALIPISNGCNNYCTYCVVPYTRGKEISRPFEEVIKECIDVKNAGYKKIMLIGQNVNSYGNDLLKNAKMQSIKPVFVKHLGRFRIPTLFPHLLEKIAQLGFEKIEFISSNPWDFSDELIDTIFRNKNISRTIHLPVQSGDTNVLKRMNRWYTSNEYINLVAKIKSKIPNIKITTDIIVGFCGETEEEFQNTVRLCKKVGFEKAYIAQYSSRPMTVATRKLIDNIPHVIKEKRWQILENLINVPYLKKFKKENGKSTHKSVGNLLK